MNERLRSDAVREPAARILVVEDEDSLADSLRYNLEREGFSVSVAADGHTALARFRIERKRPQIATNRASHHDTSHQPKNGTRTPVARLVSAVASRTRQEPPHRTRRADPGSPTHITG